MFGPNPLNGFSLGKVIGGISKTLGVMNQLIPLYKEAKPMITNARNALGIIKEFSNNATNRVMSNTQKNLGPIKEKINVLKEKTNTTMQKGPTFFQ